MIIIKRCEMFGLNMMQFVSVVGGNAPRARGRMFRRFVGNVARRGQICGSGLVLNSATRRGLDCAAQLTITLYFRGLWAVVAVGTGDAGCFLATLIYSSEGNLFFARGHHCLELRATFHNFRDVFARVVS